MQDYSRVSGRTTTTANGVRAHQDALFPAGMTAMLRLMTALAFVAAIAGCARDQPLDLSDATARRNLDSGITSSNGGGQRYLGNGVNVGITTPVR